MQMPRHSANVKSYHRAVWLAWLFLKSKRIGCYAWCWPAELAKSSGMTRLEAELSLRALVHQEMATRRNDGRFFLSTRAIEEIKKQEQK